MYSPLVSICIPTYNGEQFIEEAIESAIFQTYSNKEIIVSDDMSKDNTLKIIESFKSKTDIPIKIYHHNPSNIGANWNNCLKNAQGKYIKFLFQDDVLGFDCIKKMVDLIENHPKVGLVASKREIVVEDTILINESKEWELKYGDLQRALNLIKENNVYYIDYKFFKSKQFFKPPINKIGEPSVFLFRKDILTKIGYFREDLNQILDYEFCCRILKKYKIAILDEKLVKFRLHSNQASNVNKINSASENLIYQGILYENYFWYFNLNQKIILLKIYNEKIKFIFKIMKKMKSSFKF